MTRKSSSITIRDVARQAGVSVATVSRYLNRTAPVSNEVAERLEQVMAQLRYSPHTTARQLATHKTHLIGLLLSDMPNEFFTPLLNGIESVVNQHNYNLLVATHRSPVQETSLLPVGPHNVDGLLVFADSLKDDELAHLHAQGFPVVLIHRTSPPSLDVPCVTIENKAATRKLIQHLIEVHGKQRIVLINGPLDQEDAYWREIGFKAALEAHHLPLDPALILQGGFESEIAYQAMQQFLESQPPAFDAVFGADDETAMGAINALKTHGYRVPEDIAVAGFDDLRLSAFVTPALTTVRAPTQEVGRTAAKHLFNLLNQKPVDPITLLPTEIVLRRSCGCLAEVNSHRTG